MIEIRVDRDACAGHGNCVLANPDVFDIDDDGLVVLVHSTVDDDRLASIQRSVYDCPTEAISLTEGASE
jgi:ferredoxin